MKGMQIRAGQEKEIKSLKKGLVIAIDIGFSKSSKTCGIAWKTGEQCTKCDNKQFGACIDGVCDLLGGHSKAVLIVEAPLSGRFGESENPFERGDFEKCSSGGEKITTRYWYCGSGAAMCLAAIIFLRKLYAGIQQSADVEIILYEGFVTFKQPETAGHDSDAKLLLDCFIGKERCSVASVDSPLGGGVITVLDIVEGAKLGSSAPAIIIPNARQS